MMGKTHAMAAGALALAVMRPDTIPMLTAGSLAAVMGGITSDMDSGSSPSHHGANGVVIASILLPVMAILADSLFRLGMSAYLVPYGMTWLNAAGALLFILLCALGRKTAHRTVTHSLAAMVLMTGCVWALSPALAPYYGIGFASHLLLDLTNKKGMQLLWPLRKKLCLGWWSASGPQNSRVFWGSLALFALLAIVLGFLAFPSWHPVRGWNILQHTRIIWDTFHSFGQ